MTRLEEFDVIVKHCWSEPKFVAKVQWMGEHPDPVSQIFAQLGSQPVSKREGDVYRWLEDVADETVSVMIHEEPDWDWWEPRHDQLWRRAATRDRELDALLEAA